MRFLGTIAALIGFAVLGAIVGYGVGFLTGAAWVWVMNTSSFEGYSAMLIFFGFGPVAAIIGALALPGLYLRLRMPRASGSAVRENPPRRRSF